MSVSRTILQTFPIPELPGYESRLVKIEFPPGVGAALHNHPVTGNGMVLAGDYISQYDGQEVQHYTAGDVVEDLMGLLHARAENANKDRPLTLLFTYVIPPGENSTLIPPEYVPPAEPACDAKTGSGSGWWRSCPDRVVSVAWNLIFDGAEASYAFQSLINPCHHFGNRTGRTKYPPRPPWDTYCMYTSGNVTKNATLDHGITEKLLHSRKAIFVSAKAES